ncbi:MAG TPA: YggT family protein [Candidatus Binatia bacterium]|nr:YggT family protein [Candidatus Binatia bacterium]
MANADNALLFLFSTLFELYLWVLLLRILLQLVRADFYNPISQLIWQVTQMPVRPLQVVLPKVRRFDTAAAVLAWAVALAYVYVACWLLHQSVGFVAIAWYALLKLLVLLLNLYTLSLFVQAILSWVGPGVSNPAGSILWSMNEPLLRPVRRVIPPMSGLDLAPLVVILLLQVANRLVPLPGLLR